ncbi:MAG: porin [Rhizobiaceae bacterium]
MNIKSLLIGSAAALVATTGARAADAIVMPEPEPVEYVRVCDMYGAGFFYIPGTETCLRVSGKVWFDIIASSANDWYATRVEADLNFDARSETEWGTLRGFVQARATWDPQNQILGSSLTNILGVLPIPPGIANSTARFGTDGNLTLNQAYITLGGLFMGYSESLWAAGVLNPGASNGGSYTWGGLSYGYQQRHSVSYSFNGGNGFFGTLALEDDGNANWMPDVVGKIGVAQGWGAVWAKAAYDEDLTPGGGAFLGIPLPAPAAFLGARLGGLSGVDGWAASIGAQINVPNMPGSSLRLIGFYASNANAYSVGGRWSVLGSYRHQFNPAFAASVGAQYIADTNFAAAGNPNTWLVEGALYWTPVQNFEIRTEITHTKATGVGGVTGGFLRFTRMF